MPFDTKTVIVAATIVIVMAIVKSAWRCRLHLRSSDTLTRMYGVLEDLTKSGIATESSLRTKYAAIQFCHGMAALYHSDGKYRKAIIQASAAIAQAEALMGRDSEVAA
jgi:hypothetical protein